MAKTTYKPMPMAPNFLPRATSPAPEPPPAAFVEPKPTGPNQQFGLMRQQVSDRFASAGGEQKDALNRRLAALGNLNSGAAIKQEQNILGGIEKQKSEAMGGIDVSEAAANAQNEQAAMQRQLQNTQFERSLGEQKRQNSFSEGLALDEANLNRFNTMYNTALSAATSEAGPQINAMFENMFGSKMNLNGEAVTDANRTIVPGKNDPWKTYSSKAMGPLRHFYNPGSIGQKMSVKKRIRKFFLPF